MHINVYFVIAQFLHIDDYLFMLYLIKIIILINQIKQTVFSNNAILFT